MNLLVPTERQEILKHVEALDAGAEYQHATPPALQTVQKLVKDNEFAGRLPQVVAWEVKVMENKSGKGIRFRECYTTREEWK